jgi:hypothetical protein
MYDVMSIWPIEGGGANQYSRHRAKLAMALLGKNKHYRFADVHRRHFNSTAAKCFLRADAENVIEKVCWQEHPAPSRQWLRDYLQDFRNGSQRRSLPGSSDPQNNWLSIDLMTLSELATESGRANGWTVRIRNNYHSEQFITPRKLSHHDRSPSLQQTPTQEKAPR